MRCTGYALQSILSAHTDANASFRTIQTGRAFADTPAGVLPLSVTGILRAGGQGCPLPSPDVGSREPGFELKNLGRSGQSSFYSIASAGIRASNDPLILCVESSHNCALPRKVLGACTGNCTFVLIVAVRLPPLFPSSTAIHLSLLPFWDFANA